MRFLPLTMAEMGGDGICVAGIDVDSLWGRISILGIPGFRGRILHSAS